MYMLDANLEEKMTRIYNATYDGVLKFVVSKCKNPSDIHDIMQNIYMKFYERLKKKSDIKEPERYIYSIAKGEIWERYQNWNLDSKNIPVFSPGEDEDFSNMEAELNLELPEPNSGDYGELWQFIKSCDELTFKIFVLHFHYDEKIDDVAKALNISPSMVKHRLYRTIQKVRDKFKL